MNSQQFYLDEDLQNSDRFIFSTLDDGTTLSKGGELCPVQHLWASCFMRACESHFPCGIEAEITSTETLTQARTRDFNGLERENELDEYYGSFFPDLIDLTRPEIDSIAGIKQVFPVYKRNAVHMHVVIVKDSVGLPDITPFGLLDRFSEQADKIETSFSEEANKQIEKLGLKEEIWSLIAIIQDSYDSLSKINVQFHCDPELPEWKKFRLCLTVSNDSLQVLEEETKFKKYLLQEFDNNIRELLTFSYNWA